VDCITARPRDRLAGERLVFVAAIDSAVAFVVVVN